MSSIVEEYSQDHIVQNFQITTLMQRLCSCSLSLLLMCLFRTEPMEHSLDNGDGPPIPPVKCCTPEFYRDHQHSVSSWQKKNLLKI